MTIRHTLARKERKAVKRVAKSQRTKIPSNPRRRENTKPIPRRQVVVRQISQRSTAMLMKPHLLPGDTWSDDYYWDSTYGCWVYYEQWDNQHESWNYFAHDGWDVRSDHRCREMATNFSPLGMVFFIILLMEILLHHFSLFIGYANQFLHQIRLIVVSVSHQFSDFEVEFTQHFAEHEERHFAEVDEVRHNGQESPEEIDVRYNGPENEEPKVRNNGHAYLNYESNVQHTLLTDYVEMSTNPTYVILDSGCTRAMGSRFAIDRLVKACTNHRYSHLIKFTKEASNNKFSFANGESSHVKEKLVIHLKNPKHPTGWITTTVDILDKGRVPILFSVEQMRNLRMNIEHTPAGEFLTCPVFGLKRYALSVATSNHPILDVVFLAKCGQKPEHSFAATDKITPPACNGRHRKHTYDEHCNLDKPREPRPPRVVREIRKPIDEKTPVVDKESRTNEPTRRLGVKTTPTPRPVDETDEPTQRPTESIPVEPDKAIVEEPPKTSSSSGTKKMKPVVVDDESSVPIRQKKDPKIKADLPLALKRIHEKLDSPVELYKLHLKHYHMSTEQFRRRTSALKIPEEIYQKYDLIVRECDVCQKIKKGPSRSKISGMRSEVFGDLTFIDHAEIPLDGTYKLMFLIIYDGATQLMTAFPSRR